METRKACSAGKCPARPPRRSDVGPAAKRAAKKKAAKTKGAKSKGAKGAKVKKTKGAKAKAAPKPEEVEEKVAKAPEPVEEAPVAPPAPPAEPREEEPPEEPEAVEEIPAETTALLARIKDEAEAVAETIANSIKEVGPAYLDDAKIIPALAKCEDQGLAAVVKAVIDTEVNVIPLLVRTLPSLLQLAGAKRNSEGAKEAVEQLCDAVTPEAFPNVVQYLLDAVDATCSPSTRVLALGMISKFRTTAPEEVAQVMQQLVPVVSLAMTEVKAEVRDAAVACMDAIAEVIGNNDIEPALPDLKGCIVRPDETEACIYKLSATTFVQPVTQAAMSILVPLLIRGLRERQTSLRRQTCKIIMNMAKLVEDPRDAAPFLPEIMPLLARTVETVSDPEARSVCRRAHHQMLDLENSCNSAPLPPVTKHKMMVLLTEKIGEDKATDFLKKTMKYVAVSILSLAHKEAFLMGPWTTNIAGALSPYIGEEAATEVCRVVREDVQDRCTDEEEADEDDDAEQLCDCEFTLAYGTNVLLNNTKMKLKRGYRYGLLGPNDCGKTTLLRAIANGQVEGFPDPTVVRTVFVEADILGELSHFNVTDYVAHDKRIEAAGIPREEVSSMLEKVGFTDKMRGDPITTLSGGWRMKLAIARAMLQNADILLMDEPTNHLDVMNVAWVKNYLLSLKDVTSILVSHDSGLLTDVCTHIMEFRNLKLHLFKGNLTEFVRIRPEARAYFEFKATRLKFTFPQPTYIDGVRSRSSPLMRVTDASLVYPGNTQPTIEHATVSVSRASRVACIGPNGAGKSTLIKVLTGEVEPTTGSVWHHPAARIGYIAQHAFHHIEQHLSKTPNEYIRWRYAGGQDKENIARDTMILTDEEKKLQAEAIEYVWEDEESGETRRANRVIEKLTGARRQNRDNREDEYECKWRNMDHDHNGWVLKTKLEKRGWAKVLKKVDAKIAAQAGMQAKPLTMENVAQHLENVGLEREFGSHCRIASLSGGQKVKVVLAAALWMCPHVIILDEPTNYLDRESLGALAGAIEEFEGGVVIISHNNDFVTQLCPVTWVVEKDPDGISRPDTRGDQQWMEHALEAKQGEIEKQVVEAITDAYGNEVKVEQKKTMTKKQLKKKTKEILKKITEGLDLDEEEEALAEEHNLYAEAQEMAA
eukprot:scaffold2036_cov256-Pinguiococcus_pyrenoidosus.AAC.15